MRCAVVLLWITSFALAKISYHCGKTSTRMLSIISVVFCCVLRIGALLGFSRIGEIYCLSEKATKSHDFNKRTSRRLEI
jgi:hypothetical protein